MLSIETLERVTQELWEKPGIPPELAWMRHLSDVNERRFLVELADVTRQAQANGDWNTVGRVLERWERVAADDSRRQLPYRLRFGAGEESRPVDLAS